MKNGFKKVLLCCLIFSLVLTACKVKAPDPISWKHGNPDQAAPSMSNNQKYLLDNLLNKNNEIKCSTLDSPNECFGSTQIGYKCFEGSCYTYVNGVLYQIPEKDAEDIRSTTHILYLKQDTLKRNRANVSIRGNAVVGGIISLIGGILIRHTAAATAGAAAAIGGSVVVVGGIIVAVAGLWMLYNNSRKNKNEDIILEEKYKKLQKNLNGYEVLLEGCTRKMVKLILPLTQKISSIFGVVNSNKQQTQSFQRGNFYSMNCLMHLVQV